LQGILHEQIDLENSAFQNFEEEIVFIKMDPMIPTLTLQVLIFLTMLMYFMNTMSNKEIMPYLPLVPIAKLSVSRKLTAMATKLLASDSHTSRYLCF